MSLKVNGHCKLVVPGDRGDTGISGPSLSSMVVTGREGDPATGV